MVKKYFLTLCLIFFGPAISLADQTDARLDELFSVLRQTENTNIIQQAENRIWEIWMEHSDDDVEALMLLGTQRMNMQYYSDALAVYSEIISAYPDYAEAWNKRATLYYLAGNLDASIDDIEKTLELEPRHFGALSGLGLVYIQREELQKAKTAFEALIKVLPQSPNAKQNLEMVNQSLRLSII
ncbi:MAG: tetratricopeptide repeat protein [Gammaproteobacteria bacterium]|jgi:tetratricopeptide (TPR) repeat protein|nr:tetratricopeptide repeat protein [Gammaproteobacteria bacterium]|tara:strand:- start:104 stop:655 length:552 start_codon:yes stop_codon:yes gene_type:complete